MIKPVAHALVLLVLLSTAPGRPAGAADPYGYWSVAAGSDSVKLGLVFPDFSPNEFAGVLFTCRPGTAAVEVAVDLPDAVAPGSPVEVVLSTPRDVGRYRGRVEILQPDDRVVVRAATTLEDPLFEGLASSSSLSLTVAGREMALPVRNADRMVRRFLVACGGAEKSRAE